jgi:hypothetical protein
MVLFLFFWDAGIVRLGADGKVWLPRFDAAGNGMVEPRKGSYLRSGRSGARMSVCAVTCCAVLCPSSVVGTKRAGKS